ncbi:MAG: hypothetical protein KAZ04_04035 [Sebaldella sp.]|nr:hypothetical protein [Sebaldella sp.]
MELKHIIREKLKELLNIFEKYGEKELDSYISDIYYLLSLYSLNIIPFSQLKSESTDIINNWFPNNSRSGLNEFYFSNVDESDINVKWRKLIDEINLRVGEL